MRLVREVEAAGDAGVRVLPARAMRRALKALTEREYAGEEGGLGGLLCEAVFERLNDARMDAVVAMSGQKPVGRCGLFQVGEIGRVCGCFVLPEHRGRGVGREMMGHVVRLARRLMLRVVCLPIRSREAEAAGFFEACGFVRDGSVCEFVSPGQNCVWT